MMRTKRILFGLVLALTVSIAPAEAAPDDPYLIYVANRQVAKGQTPWPVILRADATTGEVTELSRNGRQGDHFVHPYDVASERSGSLIVVDMGQFASDDPAPDGAVIRVDPRNGNQSLVSRGGALVDPAGVAVSPGGALYVLENVGVGGARGVIRVDPVSGAQTVVAQGGELCNPFGIAFEPSGNLVVADYGTLVLNGRPIVECETRPAGALVRIDPSTGRQTVLAEGNLLRSPFGLAIEPGGRILVANEGVTATAGVVGVNPATGAQSVVSANTGSDVFRLPERVALAPDGRLLVTDFELADRYGGLVRVAPEDGAQTTAWQGELFNNPLGLAVVVNRPPTAALTASPSAAAGGQPVRFDASGSTDPEGLGLRYDWDLDGDGTFEKRTSAPMLSQAYAETRALTAQVRVSDPHGAGATAAATLTVDATAPLVEAFGASARVLVGRGSPRKSQPRSAAARPRRATTFRYSVSEPAGVAIRIERALPGRRVRGTCRAPGRRKVRRRARCTRWRPILVLRQQAVAGANALRFGGRARGRRLRAGPYRAIAEAADTVGNRSQPRTVRLRVVSPR